MFLSGGMTEGEEVRWWLAASDLVGAVRGHTLGNGREKLVRKH